MFNVQSDNNRQEKNTREPIFYMVTAKTTVMKSEDQDGNLKRCDGSLRREAIDHVGVSDQYQVQPTTTPLSACCHTKLSASGL